MNEYQVAVGETTFRRPPGAAGPQGGGRLRQPDEPGPCSAGRTAREAIQVMTSLVEDYGYASSGESFSISDSQRSLDPGDDLQGPGAQRSRLGGLLVPDGYVCAHANQPRIIASPGRRPITSSIRNRRCCMPQTSYPSPGKGVLQGRRRRIQLRRRLRPADFEARRFCEAASGSSSAASPRFPADGRLQGLRPGHQAGRRAHPPVHQARQETVGGATPWSWMQRPLRGHGAWT